MPGRPDIELLMPQLRGARAKWGVPGTEHW